MKKLLVIAVASLSLIAAQSYGAVGIALDASTLLEAGSGSAAISTVSLVLLVVDVSGNGVSTADLTVGQDLSLGGTIGDDLIIARFDCQVGGLGYVSGNTQVVGTSGKPLGLIWFSGNTIGDNSLVMTTASLYGSLINAAIVGGDVWTMPSDGADISLVLSTADEAASEGFSTHNVIPEPSTYMLVGTGLLGLLALRRRHS